jgi:hypothetical protein
MPLTLNVAIFMGGIVAGAAEGNRRAVPAIGSGH